MASRSAKSPKRRKPENRYEDEGGIGAFLAKHRFAVGGTTAFAVAFAYVAANAIWYQPHPHGGAFFATRPSPVAVAPTADAGETNVADSNVETIIKLEREAPVEERLAALETPPVTPQPRVDPAQVPIPAPSSTTETPSTLAGNGDAVVQDVQRILAELNLYDGKVDGLTGPQTRGAIENYRRIVGLTVSADIDDQLLRQLGATPRAESSSPPLPQGSPGTDMIETSSSGAAADPMIMKIQAGLKAFGNEGIDIDGVVGSRTKSAIVEFQSLFGLPETGQPDEALYAKMREIGLTN
jgi:peptidoglycan hydrolase-like protein with peptidoglycan-binding domain